MPKRGSRRNRNVVLRGIRTVDHLPIWQIKFMHMIFGLFYKYQADLETEPLFKGEHVLAYIPGEIERSYQPVRVHDKGDGDCWVVYDLNKGMFWSVKSEFLFRDDDMTAETAATIAFALGIHQDGPLQTVREISYAYDKWKTGLQVQGIVDTPAVDAPYAWPEFFIVQNRLLKLHLQNNVPSWSYPTTF